MPLCALCLRLKQCFRHAKMSWVKMYTRSDIFLTINVFPRYFFRFCEFFQKAGISRPLWVLAGTPNVIFWHREALAKTGNFLWPGMFPEHSRIFRNYWNYWEFFLNRTENPRKPVQKGKGSTIYMRYGIHIWDISKGFSLLMLHRIRTKERTPIKRW